MNRAITTLGVVGLALLSVAAPASAENENQEEKKVTICHESKLISVALNSASVNGHVHNEDIIEPNEFLPSGWNWTADGFKNCGVVVTPGGEGPGGGGGGDEPGGGGGEEPGGEEGGGPGGGGEEGGGAPTPVQAVVPVQEAPAAVTPAGQTPAPQAAAPKAAAKVPAAAASVVRGANEGYNAQTSVGGAGENTTWLAGLGVLMGAGALVAMRRRSRTESPTAG